MCLYKGEKKFLTRMKSNHQIWLGCLLFLHQLLPELMVEALVGADVDSLFGSKSSEGRPHNGAVHHLRPHHDYFDPLVSGEHVVQLIVVGQSGSHGFIVRCPH